MVAQFKTMAPYVVLEKEVGETPLSCAEKWRAAHPEYQGVPLAYAGRLDPMASGKLLVLIGDECKYQEKYHNLDKEYKFSVLFGITSDTADVLGRLETVSEIPEITETILKKNIEGLAGDITLPYPKFSAKTVKGKPLHMWTLEGKLDEIELPTKTSHIYHIGLDAIESRSRESICNEALEKIESIPPVTEERKALGNDFRRVDVRKDWHEVLSTQTLPTEYTIAHFTCAASSGTYMRTLATVIAEKAHTIGLAWHIHRNAIGTYDRDTKDWSTTF